MLELTGGGVDHAFEAIGLKATAEQAFNMLRKGGTATVIGMIPLGEKVEIDGFQLLMEKRLQGSNMGSNRFRIDMPQYIEWYLAGKLKLDELVSGVMPLEKINDGFAALKGGEVARQLITFDSSRTASSTIVPAKKFGFVPAHSATGLPNVNARKSARSRCPCSTSSHASQSTRAKSGTSQWPMSLANSAGSCAPCGLRRAVERQRRHRVVGFAAEEVLLGEDLDDVVGAADRATPRTRRRRRRRTIGSDSMPRPSASRSTRSRIRPSACCANSASSRARSSAAGSYCPIASRLRFSQWPSEVAEQAARPGRAALEEREAQLREAHRARRRRTATAR